MPVPDNNTRQVYLLTGEQVDVYQCISESTVAADINAIVVSPDPVESLKPTVVDCRQALEMIGQEKQLVYIDLFSQICVDAIAAVAGIVTGGGVLVFCMPDKETWHTKYSSLFSRRLIEFIENFDGLKRLQVCDNNVVNCSQQILQAIKPAALLNQKQSFTLTDDQQQVFDEIIPLFQMQSEFIRVLISDRGRGKSTTLGVIAAALLQQKCQEQRTLKILVTAPSFLSSKILFQQAARNLSLKAQKKPQIEFENSIISFRSPDELLQSAEPADLLLVDEAAAIPLPLLMQIQKKYPRVVLATTVHGYEGTGRGFFVRFFPQLERLDKTWKKLELKQPVRWSVEDKLEPWLFRLLCLDAEIDQQLSKGYIGQCKVEKISRQQLSNDERLLRELFALLVLAHYRTRPSDLQRLLDDDIEIYIMREQGSVIAAAIGINEGEFDAQLAEQVYYGERRPKGHLLAQTLTFHCGVENAAELKVLRIMRIIVHPQLQNDGIGSSLLQSVINYERDRDVDIVGASFGATKSLINFWQKNQFRLVRLGFKKEKSSGERAGVFVHALTNQGEQVVNRAETRFYHHTAWLKQRFNGEDEIFNVLSGIKLDDKSSEQLTEDDVQDIERFCLKQVAYELCVTGVNKWLLKNKKRIHQCLPESENIIWPVVERQINWKQLADELNLSGKKQANELFSKTVQKSYALLNNDN